MTTDLAKLLELKAETVLYNDHILLGRGMEKMNLLIREDNL